MTVASPVRIDRAVSAIRAVVLDALGSTVEVLQAGQALAREGLGSFVSLNLREGPSPVGPGVARIIHAAPTQLTVTILTATQDRRYVVELNGWPYRHDAGATDDRDDIRDELLAQINADTLEPITASAGGGTGELVLVPDRVGAIASWRIRPELLTSVSVVGTTPARVLWSHRTMRLSVQCFSAETGLEAGALDMAARIQAAFETEQNRLRLHDEGVAVWGQPGPILNLTGLSGAEPESRAVFELQLAAGSLVTEAVDRITSVDLEYSVTP